MANMQCPCGREIAVRDSQAGTTVRCECGQELIVPSLNVLRSACAEGTSAAAIVKPSDRAPSDRAPMSEHERQFLVFLTHPRILPQRISFDAASHFVTACDRVVQHFFDSADKHCSVDLQVSVAIFPSGQSLVDVQVQPTDVLVGVIGQLTDQLQQMPRPKVIGGPIAFTFRRIVHGGSPSPPRFEFPFRTLLHRSAEIDRLLIEAGVMALDSRSVDTTPSSPGQPSLWSRLATLLNRFLGRRSTTSLPTSFSLPSDSPITPPARDTQVSDAQSARAGSLAETDQTTVQEQQTVLAVLQSSDIAEVESCRQQHPQVSQLYLHLGQLYAQQKNYAEAVAVLTELVQREPDNPIAYAMRGRFHVLAGSMQHGLADYTIAIEKNPTDAESRAARAMIYLELEAWEFAEAELTAAIKLTPIQPQLYVERARVRYAQQKIGDVLHDLDHAHGLDPYHVDAYMLHGWTLQHRPNATLQDIEDATGHYSHAIQIDPQNTAYYLQRAEAYVSQSKFALAIADCDSVLQLDEASAVALGIRGYAHQQLDNLDEAVTDCSRAIELGLRSAAVYVSRAVGYAAQGQIEWALADCDTAVELAPDYAVAFNYRGMLRLGLGEVEAATADFVEACRLAPDWSIPRSYRADAHRLQSEYEQAIEQYTHNIEMEPRNVTAFIGRALAWMEKNELDKAAQDLTQALHIDPQCAPAYFHRAELFVRQERYRDALADLNQTIAFDPNFAPGYHARGQVFLQLQMNQEALNDFSRLIELHPSWPGAYLGRANAWIHLGDTHKAAADYQEAANLDPGSTEELLVHRLIVEARHAHQQESYELAIAKATEALERDERCLPALATRAASYWYSECFVEAADDYTLLVELAPQAIFALVGRGQVYAELGEYEAALVDLDKAVSQERAAHSQTGLAYALNGRALAYAGQQRFDDAERDFAESISLRPDNGWVHYNHALMFHRQDRLPQAVASFRQALAASDPPLTKRKRERAEAFLRQQS